MSHERRYALIRATLETLGRTMAAPSARWLAGRGVILTLHRVTARPEARFAVNRGLEITPDFLDAALRHLRRREYDIVPLDALPERLRQAGPRFAAITLDDGYIDTLTEALPVLERHGAPASVFAVPGFLDRTATLWWLDLEAAVVRLDKLECALPDGAFVAPCATDGEKRVAFEMLYARLRALPESTLRQTLAALCRKARIEPARRVADLCLDEAGLRALARHPLITIGAHTLTHPRLATLCAAQAREEIEGSRTVLQALLDRPVRHVCYPVGDPASAGAREFALAREMRFATGLTTRPGVLWPDHGAWLTALPRLSLNGHAQSLAAFDALLSGLPFALANRFQRLNVA